MTDPYTRICVGFILGILLGDLVLGSPHLKRIESKLDRIPTCVVTQTMERVEYLPTPIPHNYAPLISPWVTNVWVTNDVARSYKDGDVVDFEGSGPVAVKPRCVIKEVHHE